MQEAENLCDRIAIMVNGQLYCIGTPQELREKFGEGYNVLIKGVDHKIEVLERI
jgi:ABC-type multidrug transport system ATPase subunit